MSARDLLVHERRTRLFMTGRRLADMYRFGIVSETWVSGSAALEQPGTLFPIPTSEVDANCYLNGSCSTLRLGSPSRRRSPQLEITGLAGRAPRPGAKAAWRCRCLLYTSPSPRD